MLIFLIIRVVDGAGAHPNLPGKPFIATLVLITDNYNCVFAEEHILITFKAIILDTTQANISIQFSVCC